MVGGRAELDAAAESDVENKGRHAAKPVRCALARAELEPLAERERNFAQSSLLIIQRSGLGFLCHDSRWRSNTERELGPSFGHARLPRPNLRYIDMDSSAYH